MSGMKWGGGGQDLVCKGKSCLGGKALEGLGGDEI